MAGYYLNYIGDAYMPGYRLDLTFQGYLSQFQCNFPAGSGGQSVNTGQSAFQFSDICVHLASDVFSYLIGDTQAAKVGFLLDNRNSCIVARRVDSGNQSPVESADKTLFKRRNLTRRAVGAQDDLFTVIIKGIKGFKEFFLTLLAFAQKLNIVDYQRFDRAKLALKTSQISLLYRSYISVDKFFTA